jgi:hypothetical protein
VKNIGKLETFVRRFACDESGEQSCSLGHCQLRASGCIRTYRKISSKRNLTRANLLAEDAVRTIDLAISTEARFKAESLAVEARRLRAFGEIGVNVTVPDADLVKRFCVNQALCIHDVRVLLDSRFAKIVDYPEAPLELTKRRHFLWLDAWNGIGLMSTCAVFSILLILCPDIDALDRLKTAPYAAMGALISLVCIRETFLKRCSIRRLRAALSQRG